MSNFWLLNDQEVVAFPDAETQAACIAETDALIALVSSTASPGSVFDEPWDRPCPRRFRRRRHGRRPTSHRHGGFEGSRREEKEDVGALRQVRIRICREELARDIQEVALSNRQEVWAVCLSPYVTSLHATREEAQATLESMKSAPLHVGDEELIEVLSLPPGCVWTHPANPQHVVIMGTDDVLVRPDWLKMG